MLASAEWRARLRGASCLELGCGLGLPGLVCHLLGAAPVLLTDRRDVAALVAEPRIDLIGLDGRERSPLLCALGATGSPACLPRR